MRKLIFALSIFIATSTIAQDYKFGKVSEEEVLEKTYPLDSTADAAYLYKYRRTYMDYSQNVGFQLMTEVHHRIKIYTKEGFDYATKSIVYYNPDNGSSESVKGIKGYTFYMENGKLESEKLSKDGIFKEQLNDFNSSYKITMPKIGEGCVIEYKYTMISPYATYIDDVEFQKAIPIKKLECKIEYPEFYVFNKTYKGFYSVPMKTEKRNSRIGSTSFATNVFSFDGENIPDLKNNEPFVANVNNYRGGMKFEISQSNFLAIGGEFKNYANSWESVSKEIFKSESFGNELDKTSYFKDDLEKILAVAKTDNDKINAIFQFVKTQVKWNGLYSKFTDKGVRTAYKENTGNVADINLMLTAMLREAGLEANPVLISSRGNGIPLFPTNKGFDYVISMVKFPDNSYVLLDATEEYSVPNILPVRALNWDGREVTKDGDSGWVKLSSTTHATEENMVMVKLTDDLALEGFIRTKYDNLNALNFRRNNNHIKEEELITKYEEKNKIEIDEFRVTNDEDLSLPVIRSVKFTSEDLVETINDKVYIAPLLFLTQSTNPFKLEDRKFPVDFATAWKDINQVSIDIPEGYKIEAFPEPLALALPDNIGVFKYQVQTLGNKIKTVSILEFNSPMIPPQYYAFLKDFYGKLVAKQSEKIVLVKI